MWGHLGSAQESVVPFPQPVRPRRLLSVGMAVQDIVISLGTSNHLLLRGVAGLTQHREQDRTGLDATSMLTIPITTHIQLSSCQLEHSSEIKQAIGEARRISNDGTCRGGHAQMNIEVNPRTFTYSRYASSNSW